MAKDILVDSGALGSNILKTARKDISDAKEEIDRLDYYGAMASATYISPDGVMPLFPLEYAYSAVSLSAKLEDILGKLGRYASLLDSGPDGFSEIDGKYKHELTDWWEHISPATVFKTVLRAAFPITSLMAPVVDYSVNFYIADYENYGITYKVIESVKALGKAIPAVMTCAATWATTILSGGAGAPLAILSTIYIVNTGVNCLVDLTNIWITKDYEAVGEYNLLQDTLINNAGELGEMIGNKDAGELVGEMVYDAGDILDSFAEFKKTTEIKAKDIEAKKPYTTLTDKISESDVNFNTFKEAVEEVPTGIKELKKIFNSPVSEFTMSSVKSDLKLLSENIPNIGKVKSTYKLLDKVGSITEKIMMNIWDYTDRFFNT